MNPFPRNSNHGVLSEQEWARREAWMRELLDASSDGFWEWNVVTGEVHFSGRWASMLGYSVSEIEPHVRSWERLLHPDDRAEVMRILQDHLEGRTPFYQTKHRLKKADGSWMWILDRGRVVERNPEGKPLWAAGAHIDITTDIRIEQEKEEITNRRRELLEVVSHELKNPIHAVLTSITLLRRRLLSSSALEPSLSQKDEAIFDTLLRAVRRMEALVNDLLLSTRLEAGLPELHFEQPEVGGLLDSVTQELEAKRALKEIRLIVDCDLITRTSHVIADPFRIVQVLTNLLDNALKFTPPRGTVRVRAQEVPGESQIEFSVEDSGPGIPEEEWSKVFDRYWRGRAASQPGSGIGLHIAQVLIQAHRSDITLKASSLGGVCFLFRLPRFEVVRKRALVA